MAVDMLKVKLADESLVLRRPVGEPKAGQLLVPGTNEVPNSVYWRRRLKAGEVLLIDDAASKPKVDAVELEPKTKKGKE